MRFLAGLDSSVLVDLLSAGSLRHEATLAGYHKLLEKEPGIVVTDHAILETF